MTLGDILWITAAAVLVMMVAAWAVSLPLRDVSIVDICWGLGFVLVAWVTLALSGNTVPRAWLLILMVSVWGLRLSGYLAWRNLGKAEDYRYAAMREQHGRVFPLISLFSVFLLQGLLMWVISLPVQVGVLRAEAWPLSATVGLAVWIAGLFFESVGDYQMARFKADPRNRGQVMDRGLWRYTRHPNYFGDFLVWWGLYLVAAEPASWWWTVVGPLLMSFLLVRVSGVRLLESSLRRRLEGYEEYVRRTNAFIPWPPRDGPATE
jgi:steroid 5-alpha reductase family enzyme